VVSTSAWHTASLSLTLSAGRHDICWV